jgi:hypothetical protein
MTRVLDPIPSSFRLSQNRRRPVVKVPAFAIEVFWTPNDHDDDKDNDPRPLGSHEPILPPTLIGFKLPQFIKKWTVLSVRMCGRTLRSAVSEI